MIYDESQHPSNQSQSEIMGQVAGTVVSGLCHDCDSQFENGEHARAFATYTKSTYNHSWTIRAVFCEDCQPTLTLDNLPEDTPGYNANATAIIGGNVSNGKFCPMYFKDRNTKQEKTFSIHASHRPNRNYNPSIDGETIPIPQNILESVLTGEQPNRANNDILEKDKLEILIKILESNNTPKDTLAEIKKKNTLNQSTL